MPAPRSFAKRQPKKKKKVALRPPPISAASVVAPPPEPVRVRRKRKPRVEESEGE